MKKSFLLLISLFICVTICACNSETSSGDGSRVLASIDGENITQEEFDLSKKSQEITRHITIDYINNSDMGEEEKQQQLNKLDESFNQNDSEILNGIIKQKYINSNYSAITFDDAHKYIKEDYDNILNYSGASDEDVYKTQSEISEYMKEMNMTKDEYYEYITKGYMNLVNKSAAKKAFIAEKKLTETDPDAIEKQFDEYIKEKIDKATIVYF